MYPIVFAADAAVVLKPCDHVKAGSLGKTVRLDPELKRAEYRSSVERTKIFSNVSERPAEFTLNIEWDFLSFYGHACPGGMYGAVTYPHPYFVCLCVLYRRGGCSLPLPTITPRLPSSVQCLQCFGSGNGAWLQMGCEDRTSRWKASGLVCEVWKIFYTTSALHCSYVCLVRVWTQRAETLISDKLGLRKFCCYLNVMRSAWWCASWACFHM